LEGEIARLQQQVHAAEEAAAVARRAAREAWSFAQVIARTGREK
jgi:hypothetical protein